MNSNIYFMAAFVFKITASQNFTHSTLLGTEQSLTLRCVTSDLSQAILFQLGPDNMGGCIAVGSCRTDIPGYEKPTQQGTTITEMVITSCNETSDIGRWTCTYGSSTSDPVMITTCPGGANPKPDNDNSEGWVIGVVVGVIVVVLVLVLVVVLVVWMLNKKKKKKKKKKFFNNDASETSRSPSCISLKNGTVTPHERQQPDGDEGPQSTPKDPDARHITTTGIDTLDEQKTDKKPKDKKKKKKKMKDEEQDNPAYDTEQ